MHVHVCACACARAYAPKVDPSGGGIGNVLGAVGYITSGHGSPFSSLGGFDEADVDIPPAYGTLWKRIDPRIDVCVFVSTALAHSSTARYSRFTCCSLAPSQTHYKPLAMTNICKYDK
jgi:hypothetical protein